MTLLALVVAGLLYQTPAGDASQVPSVTLPAPLARVLTDYESAWQRKDARALAALFAEDGFVLSSGGPPVRGRSAIEAHYVGHGGPLSLRALAYSTDGTTGYVIGAYSRAKDERDDGKFTLTLRKGADGRWLIVSDMDNGNSRPAPCPSPSSSPVAAQDPTEYSDFDEPPMILEAARPNYPEEAFYNRIEGTVEIRFVVDEKGRVTEPTVVKSIPGLDKAALDCVEKWKFKPARKQGRPVKASAQAPISFRIGDRKQS
jgi:TonB family protein